MQVTIVAIRTGPQELTQIMIVLMMTKSMSVEALQLPFTDSFLLFKCRAHC
jgi:hypothetical protein